MDTKSFEDLKLNPHNPRTMDVREHEALKVSLEELGDLGGFVYNVKLDRFVGGHQRYQAFKRLPGEKKIVITQRFDPAMADGTTALGYLTYNNKFYSYREVAWDEARDLAANIAANRIGGEFELEALADVNDMIRKLDEDMLKLTGQTDEELRRLQQLGNEPETEDSTKSDSMTFRVTAEQAETIDEALGNVLALREFDLSENPDRRGHALYAIAKDYLDRLHGLDNETTSPPTEPPADA